MIAKPTSAPCTCTTGWSFDAMTNGSQTTRTDAYAWTQGREITHSGAAVAKGLPVSIQERAWSSPIWYAPN